MTTAEAITIIAMIAASYGLAAQAMYQHFHRSCKHIHRDEECNESPRREAVCK